MRVAVVGYPLLSGRQWQLCKRYEAAGVDTHVVVPWSWPSIDETDHPPSDTSFTVHRHNDLFGGQIGRYVLQDIGRTLDRIDPDVVLTHGEPWTPIAHQMEFACWRRGIAHLVFTWENLNRVPQMHLQRVAERVLLPRLDGCIAGSGDARDRLRDRGFDGPVSVAPETGIDTARFSPDHPANKIASLRKRFGVADGATVALYAGRISREKGVDLILDAAPQTVSAHPHVHHLIIGDGDYAPVLRERIEQEELDSVTMVTDHQPYQLMPRIHALADVFVYPSRTTREWAEQFGYSAAEAMATGIPVVTTTCGSLPWVVGDAGVICPEDDTDALAEAVGGLVGDPARRERLGATARERVIRKFDLNAVARSHLDTFRKILTA